MADVSIPIGKSVAAYQAMKTILEFEKIPYKFALGPDGHVIQVEELYLFAVQKKLNEWLEAVMTLQSMTTFTLNRVIKSENSCSVPEFKTETTQDQA